jgi:NAD(P)-dependent dehydrogenase (short-subunit alcohol dehydrogenase family)
MGKANGRKSIFITGAASGMGWETANLFHEKGWFVGGYDRNTEGLAKLQAKLGADNCITRQLDVTNREDYAQAIIQFASETDGKMDVLFNNAGIGKGGPFEEMQWQDVMDVANVNFIGVMIGAHSAFPLLKATPNSLCFSTSSSSAIYGIPGIAVYSATKHAVKGLTEALAVEWKRFGIRVSDTLPGAIDTPILPDIAKQNAPKEGPFRLIHPVEIAKVVWASYSGNDAKLHWYVPEELHEMDKMQTASPEGMRDQMGGGFLNMTP